MKAHNRAARTVDLAIFVQSLAGRGGERFSVDLANSLAERGYQVDMVVMKSAGQMRNELAPQVRLVDLAAGRISAALPLFWKYVRAEAPSTVLAIDEYSHLIALTLKLGRRSPRIILRIGTKFSELFVRHTGFKDRYVIPILVRLFYSAADHIIAVSKGISDDIQTLATIRKEKIEVIHNPKPGDAIRARAQESVSHPWLVRKDVPVFIAVGRITTQKNFPSLIEAFALVHARTQARLLILGEGDAAALMVSARERGCDEAIDFLGHVANPYAYVAKSDAFVLSSLWEGMPNALLEALFCGVPVVAADCPFGPREILAPETPYAELLSSGYECAAYGILCAMNDPEALAAGMEALMNDPSLRVRYAERSLERAEAFSMPLLIQDYERALGISSARRNI